MKKKLLSMLLALCMVITLLPVSALAVEGEKTDADNTETTTVTETEAVAYTGADTSKVYYKTLDDAVSAKAGAITLLKDAKLTAAETTYENVEIDTNGHWIQVQENAALTLKGDATKIGNKSQSDRPRIPFPCSMWEPQIWASRVRPALQ